MHRNARPWFGHFRLVVIAVVVLRQRSVLPCIYGAHLSGLAAPPAQPTGGASAQSLLTLESASLMFGPPFCQGETLRNEKAAQRVSFGAGYPADVHADIPADVRGAKTSVKPSKSWKNKHFGADVQVQKNFGQKNFGLNFRSLNSQRVPKPPFPVALTQAGKGCFLSKNPHFLCVSLYKKGDLFDRKLPFPG